MAWFEEYMVPVGYKSYLDFRKEEGLVICPTRKEINGYKWYWEDSGQYKMSYAPSGEAQGHRLDQIDADLVIWTETNHFYGGGADAAGRTNYFEWLARRHTGAGANFLFPDLHVEGWTYTETQNNYSTRVTYP